MFSIGLVFLFGVLGLVVDVGYGYYLKQVAQAAADSAATAAAVSAAASGGTCGSDVKCQPNYSCPDNPKSDNDFDVACLYAKANGMSGQTVTLSSGTGTPATVSGLTTNYWISTTVSIPMTLGFLSVTGATGGLVSASSTGAVISSGGGGGCVYVMDPSLSGAYTIVGTAVVNSNCGIYVNSNASDAITAKGTSTTTAPTISVVGGSKITGGASVSPTPTTGAAAAADPLAGLPAPSFSGCDYTNFSSTGGTTTFNPGVFCGGIRITGQANLIFNPGTYILNGGGLTSTSANTSITGNGVFFYNTSSGYSFGPITLAGGTNVTLTAPTSGTYQGILFFQDRSINSSATNTITGGSSGTMSGSVYMPTANISYRGNSTTRQTLAFISDTFTAVGTSYFQNDSTGALTGMNSKKAYLVQ
jgi:Flp pilus assembly protein TadG